MAFRRLICLRYEICNDTIRIFGQAMEIDIADLFFQFHGTALFGFQSSLKQILFAYRL